ncbi:hypothetical protein CRUP_018349, partial [Coryphaenoides rupestris]
SVLQGLLQLPLDAAAGREEKGLGPNVYSLQGREGFAWLKQWVNWFMVVIIISTVLTCYCTLLLATGPFMQMGAVVALTLLSWFVVHSVHTARRLGSKILIGMVFAVMLFALAPENTMMSFVRSVACNVSAFETDVQISQDGVPFLMHDNRSGFLLRTTDTKVRFSGRNFERSGELTWAELQNLNAGDCQRHDVMKKAPEFKQVYNNMADMNRDGGRYLNLKYNSVSTTKLRMVRSWSKSNGC